MEEKFHIGHYAAVVGGGGKHDFAVAERLGKGVCHVVPGKVQSRCFRAALFP